MRRDWFFPSALARRLAARGVENREVAYFMLANFLFTSVIFYGAFTWSNPPWNLLSLCEAVAVAFVTVVGMTKCYDAAGGDDNPRFAAQFNCLSFPIWFWSTLIVWSAYWVVKWVVGRGLFAAYDLNDIAFTRNMAYIGGTFEWLWTFLASVLWQVLFFSWLHRSLAAVRGAA